jgi:plastocyanin
LTTPRAPGHLRRYGRLSLAAAATAVALSAIPGSAAPGTAVVAGPYAQTAGYATPTIVLPAGGELTFVNGDPLSSHNLVSKATKKVRKGKGKHKHWVRKPLFSTPVVGTGTSVAVKGSLNLKPGPYEFYCTLHPGTMTGTLIVQ